MQVLYERRAGLDVHKKTVGVCRVLPDGQGGWQRETRTFGTMLGELLAMADWLRLGGVTHVAMESTGVYWKPVFNLLEGEFEVLLVDTKHIKFVPGCKTDVKDAQWIADLLQHGLLKASFIPPAPQRELRELVWYRTHLIDERTREVNRVRVRAKSSESLKNERQGFSWQGIEAATGARDGLETAHAQQAQDEIIQNGDAMSSLVGQTAALFLESDIPTVVELIFNRPMSLTQLKQALMRCLGNWQTGNAIADFMRRFTRFEGANMAYQLEDLAQVRPV